MHTAGNSPAVGYSMGDIKINLKLFLIISQNPYNYFTNKLVSFFFQKIADMPGDCEWTYMI